MKSTTFELRTETGELQGSFELTALENLILVPVGGIIEKPLEVPPKPEGENYKLEVIEVHQLLDDIGIPTAKGVTCTDPLCKSGLGHRVRILVERVTSTESLLSEIERLVKTTPSFALGLKLITLLRNNKEH